MTEVNLGIIRLVAHLPLCLPAKVILQSTLDAGKDGIGFFNIVNEKVGGIQSTFSTTSSGVLLPMSVMFLLSVPAV